MAKADKKKIVANAWEKRLCDSFKALHPGIQITSQEEPRALDSVMVAAQYLAENHGIVRDVTIWSMVSLRKISTQDPNMVEILKPTRLPKALADFMAEKVTQDNKEIAAPGILVLADVKSVLKADPASVRALREALFQARSTHKTIIIMGTHFTLPQEIANELTLLEYALPTHAELVEYLTALVKLFKSNPRYKNLRPTDVEVHALARGCAGLTQNEAKNVLCNAIVRFGNINGKAASLALEQKAEIVKRDGIMDVAEPKVSLSDVGGLENVKAWVTSIMPLVKKPEDARKYGLRLPSGALIAGVPGCGKSYIMEAIAKEMNLTFLKLDMGAMYGGLVGESEGNMRKVFQTAEAVKPCMVFIDEVEKALGGGGGEKDGGTSSRVKQSLLTWLQEKSDEIFVACTANDLDRLESIPELIRAGRMDKVFFVDLPDKKTRMEILALKLKQYGHPLPVEVLASVADVTRAYSGAELDCIVQSAIRAAFARDPRPEHPTVSDLLHAASHQKPLSVTMKDAIDRLRQWCKDGRATPAGALLENDESDEAALKSDGLPVV